MDTLGPVFESGRELLNFVPHPRVGSEVQVTYRGVAGTGTKGDHGETAEKSTAPGYPKEKEG